jgi:PAS domain S-box-containing protein
MEAVYFSIAMITAGISAAMGSVSLLVGFYQRDNKSYLLFGCIGWLMVLFILMPPSGFITLDAAPYETMMLIKRIFIFLYYAVFPWFIYHYSGRPGMRIPQMITVFTIVSYFVMFSTSTPFERPLWMHFAMVIFGTNLAYGMAGAAWMFRSGDKREAKWLWTAMAFFGVLYVSALANHIYFEFSKTHLFGMQRYFPIHLNALALMFIVGLRLQHIAFQKLSLQRMIEAQRSRWKSLLENMPLLMLEVQRDGLIVTANGFAAARLGLTSPEELVGKTWFDLFISSQEKTKAILAFESSSHPSTLPAMKGYFYVENKEPIQVNWLSFVGSSEGGGGGNIVLIGLDVTSQESALTEVAKLRLEIEKESLTNYYSASSNTSTDIIGSSKAIGYTLQKAKQVAATNATVLLEGETGVGKELFADYIFSNSLRKHKPFIKVNCSALPSELIEDELFGHEKGAFTSAAASRTGRFELADGGTILLDEIGELPLSLQPKLLRVLQQGEFERIGGQKTLHVDVRIIASTNRDLNKEVADGRFRSDLLYRLNVFPISIPALRNRKEDLDGLIGHFIQKKSEKYGKSFQQITKADLYRLYEYPWPGNIRELGNLIERSIIQSEGDTLKLQWLENGLPESHSVSMEEMEKEHIIKILNECSWKINGVNGAAEKLDMNPNTLRSRMKKLNITRDMRPMGSTAPSQA